MPRHETFTCYLAPATLSHLIDNEMVPHLNIPLWSYPCLARRGYRSPCGLSRRHIDCLLCGTFVIRANNQVHKQGVSSSFWPQRIAQTGFSTVITALFTHPLMDNSSRSGGQKSAQRRGWK